MKKRMVTAMLAVLLGAMLWIPSFAAEPEWYVDSEGVVIGYVGQEACVTVPSEIDGKAVTGIGRSAFRSNAAIEQVVLPDGVLSIGEHAFYACENLKSIEMPDSVSSIGEGAFGKCYSLTTLTLPASLSVFDAISLHFCTAMTAVTVPEENTTFASVDGVVLSKDLSELIYYPPAKADTVYTVPDGVRAIMPGAFEDAATVEEIVLPDSLMYIEDGAFLRCEALKAVTYGGSEADWQEVGVGTDNEAIAAAEITFDPGVSVTLWIVIGVAAVAILLGGAVMWMKSRRR